MREVISKLLRLLDDCYKATEQSYFAIEVQGYMDDIYTELYDCFVPYVFGGIEINEGS